MCCTYFENGEYQNGPNNLSVICAAFLSSVPIDKVRVDVLDHIRNLLGQFII